MCAPAKAARVLTAKCNLNADDRKTVETAWESAKFAYCPYSLFPVGAAILAENANGERKIFGGCNVENCSYGGTICAERTAATKAVSEGYRKFITIAVVCPKALGGMCCGFCRQLLREFGKDATILNIKDTASNVEKWTMEEMLPESFGPDSIGMPEASAFVTPQFAVPKDEAAAPVA